VSRELGVQFTGLSVEDDQARAQRVSQWQLRRHVGGGTPGKRTRVQARYGGGGPAGQTKRPAEQIQAAAQAGVEGAGERLPHAEQIQRSFGDHDLSNVRAHIGGEAASSAQAIGAEAFATGDKVAFRDTPDLHTEAHEAAHVVQQRAGVSLDSGVGTVGDHYERNADAVADRVVAGEPAEHLLPPPAAGASAAVQRQVHKDAAETPTRTKQVAPHVDGAERVPAAQHAGGAFDGGEVLSLATDLNTINAHIDRLYDMRLLGVSDIYRNLQVKDPKPAENESLLTSLLIFAVSEAIGFATGGLSSVVVGMMTASHAAAGKSAEVHGAAHTIGHIIEKFAAKGTEEGAKMGIANQQLPGEKFASPGNLKDGRLYPEVAFFSGQCDALSDWRDDLKTGLGAFWKQFIQAHPNDPKALSAVMEATARAFVAARSDAKDSQRRSTLARWVSFVAQRGSGSEERPDGARVTKLDDLHEFSPERPQGVVHVYVDDDPSKPQHTPAVLGASVAGVPNQGTRDMIYRLPMLQLGMPIRVIGKKAGIHVTRNEAGEYRVHDSMDYLKHKGKPMTPDESQQVIEGARRLFELELFFTTLPDVAGPSVTMEDK